ncbi:MAG: BTB/POZ domain-containing protein [Gammaproteobacteria bacterium]|nr:BTB/POZ domain-containing protein [Gammaproteobacteria bacterium]
MKKHSQLFYQPDFELTKSDTVSLLVGDKCFVCSRQALIKMEYFKDKLAHEQTEIELPEEAPEIFKVFIDFIHTNHIELTKKNVLQLYNIAERYGAHALLDQCGDYLVEDFAQLLHKRHDIKADKPQAQEDICPKCGKILVPSKGENGYFWACACAKTTD